MSETIQRCWTGKDLLLVEDDEVSAELMYELFVGTGLTVHHVKEGRKAIEFFDKNPDISIVLMDIRLPDISGIEVTKHIKSKRNTPVIAQTAFAMEEERRRFISDGCDDYISKPVERDELFAKISVFLDK